MVRGAEVLFPVETAGITDTIPKNLARVLDESKPGDVFLICGSLYIMNEVRYAMGIREPQDVIYDYAIKDHGSDAVGSGSQSYIYPHEKPVEWNWCVCWIPLISDWVAGSLDCSWAEGTVTSLLRVWFSS